MVLLCGGYAIRLDTVITEELLMLQNILRMKKIGFSANDENVWFCEAVCSILDFQKIKEKADVDCSLLIIKCQDLEQKKNGSSFTKREKRKKRLLICAGSRSLFFLIDQKQTKVSVLPISRISAEIDDVWEKYKMDQVDG